jgi:hydrogenase/urease accessory protein HupE
MSGLLQAFVDGLLNPLTTPAHGLVLLALALLLARQPQRFSTLLIFALALAVGFLAIVLAVETTPARSVLLAVAAVLGVLVAAAWTPKLLAWLLAAIAGAALALDSPPQAVRIADAYAMLAGTAIGACAMLLVVAAIAGRANADWQRLGVRILGSWVAASAILVLAVQLRSSGS